MGKKDVTVHRARYKLEFKREAVRLVKGGQDVDVTAKVLGMPKQALGNWVRLSEKGQPRGAGDKPVSADAHAGQLGHRRAHGLRHEVLDEPQGQLLGQGAHREPVGPS